MARKCKLVSWESKYPKYSKLENEDVGVIKCWMSDGEEKICSSDCAAWQFKDPQKIHCLALPKGPAIADISE